MNKYIVGEKALNEAESLLSDLFQMFRTGVLTTHELEKGTLISAGLLTWISVIKENNLIKGDTNDGETMESKIA